jgi:hypothetical protein
VIRTNYAFFIDQSSIMDGNAQPGIPPEVLQLIQQQQDIINQQTAQMQGQAQQLQVLQQQVANINAAPQQAQPGLSAADLAAIAAAVAQAIPQPQQAAHINPLEQLKIELTKFIGREDENPVDEWIDLAEDYFTLKNLTTDAQKTFCAQYHLAGDARLWFGTWVDSTNTQGNKHADWDEFKRELIKISCDSLQKDDIKADFKKLAQRGKARLYVTAFRKFVTRYQHCKELMNPTPYWPDAVLIDAFVD